MFIMYRNKKSDYSPSAFTRLVNVLRSNNVCHTEALAEVSEPVILSDSEVSKIDSSGKKMPNTLRMTKDNSPFSILNFQLKKSAFTLTEVIIVLVILGVLAMILVPNMLKLVPDDHNIKYKKAFYTIQEIVQDMINDPNTCQGMVYDAGAGTWAALPAGREDQILTTCYDTSGAAPAVRNLGEEICNRLSVTQDAANCTLDSGIYPAQTTNNMNWRLPNITLDNDAGAGFTTTQTIFVDVDGCTGVNCVGNSRNSRNGVYRIYVDNTGKVTAPNDIHISFTSGTDDTTGGEREQNLLLNNPTE